MYRTTKRSSVFEMVKQLVLYWMIALVLFAMMVQQSLVLHVNMETQAVNMLNVHYNLHKKTHTPMLFMIGNRLYFQPLHTPREEVI